MLPIVEEQILERNPQFAKLYQQLITSILNPDGTTRNHPEAKDRAATDKNDAQILILIQNLEKHRFKATKHNLLEQAITTAFVPSESRPTPAASHTQRSTRPGGRPQPRQTHSSSDSLPEPLLDLILILPPFLSNANSLSHDSLALLLSNPPLSDFKALLPDLSDLVSSNLHASALGLARLIHPSTNPTFLHRHIPSLPQDLADLKDKLSSAETSLTTSRLRCLTAQIDLFQTYSKCLTCLVRSLEAKHGVISRSLELRATHISLQAQIAEKQTSLKMWKLRKQVYTPDVVSALHNYVSHLRDAKMRGAERVRALKAQLEEYDDGTTIAAETASSSGAGAGVKQRKMMRDMAREKRDMERQMEDVERDIERIGII